MKHKTFIGLAVLFVVFVATAEPALAGPGGKIASAAFETFWGRVVLGGLFVLFLPLIVYTAAKEKLAERRAMRDLRFMAAYSPQFDWLNVQARLKDCFYRVHSAWENEDLAQVSAWMTDWYWQNQQLVHLDKWKKGGLVNVCEVKKITNIKPLLFVHRNYGQEHEGSLVVISVSANMQDYLAKRDSGKVVEGSKKFKDVETIWTLVMESGAWKVSAIEEDSMSLVYAKMTKDLPAIESTVASELRA